MLAFVSQASSFYACDAYDQTTLQCTSWEVVPAPALLPVISSADALSIAWAIVHCLAIAWGFRFLFLSRLCGGEWITFFYGATHNFLSRLCGGEY